MFTPLRSSLLALVAFLLTPSVVHAQGNWSDQFDRPGLLGRVFAFGEYQGQLVAGGLGIQGDGEVSFGLTAVFDGTHWRKQGTGISSGSGNQVRAFVEYGGELIAGGRFCCAGGTSTQTIARWNGQQWQALGTGISGVVSSLEVFNGDLFAAGTFTLAGGTAVTNIARWDGSSWFDVGGGLHKSFDPEVHDLQVGPDSRLYASGEFDNAGGVPAMNVAAWDGATWSAIGTGIPGPLNAIVWDLEWFQNELYAAGNFDLVAGGQNQEKVAKWNGTSWVAVGQFPDSSIGTFVTSLSVLGTKLYAGGNIVQANQAPAERIAAFDGTTWSYTGGVSGSGQISFIWDQTVFGGRLYVGGEFSICGLSPAPTQGIVSQSIAAFDGDNWSSVGTGAGFSSSVKTTVMWNGQVIAAGVFTEAGSEVVNGPAIFDGQDWSLFASVAGGSVKSMLVWNGDLIMGGDFTSVNGQPIAQVARWDGSQWSGFGAGTSAAALELYQGQLYAGGLGGVKRWNGVLWQSFAPQIFGQIYDLHEHQGVLYIGGSMFGTSHLLTWNGTLQQTLQGGTNGSVYCFESFENDLIFGGVFTTVGGVSANRLARWDGTSFTEFGGITGTNIDSLAIFQGELHASGNLIVPGLPDNKYIARWDGSAWQPLGAGFGSGGQASTLLADDTAGHLYAGGIIAHAGGAPSWGIARWETIPSAVGTAYCFGDGTGADCPCGNTGSASGHGCQNSATQEGALLLASGQASLGADTLQLHVTESLPGLPGLFFQGSAQTNGGEGVFFGDGLLCAGGQIQRLQVLFTDGMGQASSTLPLGSAASAGVTSHYQWWYRDPAGMPCGSGFNLSNGLSVTWQS